MEHCELYRFWFEAFVRSASCWEATLWEPCRLSLCVSFISSWVPLPCGRLSAHHIKNGSPLSRAVCSGRFVLRSMPVWCLCTLQSLPTAPMTQHQHCSIQLQGDTPTTLCTGHPCSDPDWSILYTQISLCPHFLYIIIIYITNIMRTNYLISYLLLLLLLLLILLSLLLILYNIIITIVII